MAVGVIFSNRQLKGSCGGLAGMLDERGNSLCESCSTPVEECEDFLQQQCDKTNRPLALACRHPQEEGSAMH